LIGFRSGAFLDLQIIALKYRRSIIFTRENDSAQAGKSHPKTRPIEIYPIGISFYLETMGLGRTAPI
jgi:hypothetical protein